MGTPRIRLRATRPGTALVVALIGLVAGARFGGAEPRVDDLSVTVRDDTLRVSIRASQLLDERTELTIDSGLPGTCVYAIRLEDAAREPVVESYVERTLQLDLWENEYLLTDAGRLARFVEKADADSAWSRVDAHPLATVTALSSTEPYRVVVALAVEPLAAEARQRLSRYIRRNSGGATDEMVLDLGAVVSRVFGGGKANAADAPAVAITFRVADLRRDEDAPDDPTEDRDGGVDRGADGRDPDGGRR